MQQPAAERQPEPPSSGAFPHPLRLPSALRYAALGYRVFPVWSTGVPLPGQSTGHCRCPLGAKCENAGKHPASVNGFKDATTDPVQIKQWLADGKHHNYGLTPPVGVAIIDLDTDEPMAAWYELAASDPVLDATFQIDTPNGLHVYLNWPESLGAHPTKLLGSVTRWGDGDGQGYVIGAYSRHANGQYYLPAPNRKLGALSEASPNLIVATGALAAAQAVRSHVKPAARHTDGAADTHTQYQPVVGERHPLLVSVATRLRAEHKRPDQIMLGLMRERETLPQPDGARKITDRELKDILDWAMDQDEGAEIVGLTEIESSAIDATTAELIVGPSSPPSSSSVNTELGESVSELVIDSPLAVAAKAKAILSDAETYIAASPESSSFPAPLAQHGLAIDGLLGEVVVALEPDTAADPYALMAHLLAYAGVVINTSVTYYNRQPSGLFLCLVGATSSGRKGTAMRAAESVLTAALPKWVELRNSGLGSGEAVVSLLALERKRAPMVVPRAVFVETEFSKPLKVGARVGSVLDDVLRSAFDGDPLQSITVTRGSIRVDDHLVAVIGHITPKELREDLPKTSIWNGSANRFLWLPVEGKPGAFPMTPPPLRAELVDRLRLGLLHGDKVKGGMMLSRSASDLLRSFESEVKLLPGKAGLLSRRHPAIAARVALIHAVVDRSSVIDESHVRRGIALCQRGMVGLNWTFPSATGSKLADRAYAYLSKRALGWISQQELTNALKGSQMDRDDAMQLLLDMGLVEVSETAAPRGSVGSGRPARMWRAVP